jgi:hypothetical protein
MEVNIYDPNSIQTCYWRVILADIWTLLSRELTSAPEQQSK